MSKINHEVEIDEEEGFGFGKTESSKDTGTEDNGTEELTEEQKKEQDAQEEINAATEKQKAGKELSEEEQELLDTGTEELTEEQKAEQAAQEEALKNALEKEESGEELSEEEQTLINENKEKENEFFFEEGSAEEEEANPKDNLPSISFKEIADDFEIELEDDSKDEFVNKINEKIESAKQEFKLDEYNETTQKIIKHVNENDGDVKDFFTNSVISEMQAVKSLDPDTKVKTVLVQELIGKGSTAEEAEQEAEERLKEMGTREVKDYSENLDKQADKYIEDEINKIVDVRQKAVDDESQKMQENLQKEKNSLISYIKEQNDYLGIPLGKKAIASIEKDIITGNFDKIVKKSSNDAKFAAYMNAKFGKKINERIAKNIEEQTRQVRNDTLVDSIKKTSNVSTRTSTGHQAASEGKERFSGFAEGIE